MASCNIDEAIEPGLVFALAGCAYARLTARRAKPARIIGNVPTDYAALAAIRRTRNSALEAKYY